MNQFRWNTKFVPVFSVCLGLAYFVCWSIAFVCVMLGAGHGNTPWLIDRILSVMGWPWESMFPVNQPWEAFMLVIPLVQWGGLGILADLAIWRLREAQRKRPTAGAAQPCQWCGYDLGGLDQFAPCPECGAVNQHAGQN